MGFEQRGEKFYGYVKRRTPDGVVSEYYGTSYGAQSKILGQEVVRHYKTWVQEGFDTLARAAEAADRSLDIVRDANRNATRILLTGLGFYQHKGQWRKRRGISTWQRSELPFPSFAPNTPLLSLPALDYTLDFQPLPNRSPLKPTRLAMGVPAQPFTIEPFVPPDEDDAENPPTIRAPEIDADPTPEAAQDNDLNYTDLPLGKSSFQKSTEHVLDDNTQEALRTNLKMMRQYVKLIKSMPPNQEAADAMRNFLARCPALWSDMGLLPYLTAHDLARTLAPEHREDQLLILERLDRFRLDLGLLQSPPHEQQLIDQLALALLSHKATSFLHATFAYGPGKQPEYGEYWEERLAKTERRLDYAVTQLSRVRKLTRSTKKVQKDLARYLDGIAPPRTAHDEPASEPTEPTHRWWWGPRRPDPDAASQRPSPERRSSPPTVQETLDAFLEKYPDYLTME